MPVRSSERRRAQDAYSFTGARGAGRQPQRPRLPCVAEPLEERMLFAAALRLGGSGYSGTLSTNPATRQQQLICDPAEPFQGSTSVTYDASQVSLAGVTAGPGYIITGGSVAISNFDGGENLIPLNTYLQQRPSGETGYVQISYRLTGTPGQIQPPTSNTVVDEAGVDGIDTHALVFEERIIITAAAVPTYTIGALAANTRGGNAEDFLIVNDAQRTRLGPAQLASATVSTSPTNGSLSGTLFEDADADGVRDASDPPLPNGRVYLDINHNGVRDFTVSPGPFPIRIPEPTTLSDENGAYLFDNVSPGTYDVRLVTPAGFLAPPSFPASGVQTVSVTAGRRTRGVDFGSIRAVSVRVTDVFVGGTTWSAAFRKYLADHALGEAAYGFNVGAGTAALDELPWIGLNQISIRFSSQANVGPYHLVIRGQTVPQYAITNFVYDVATRTATWTLAAPLPADRLTLDLNGDAGGVTDPTGHSLLDGESTNNSLPSGNGTVGGDFRFLLNVLPGDANRSGGVTVTDVGAVKARQGAVATPDSPIAYSALLDLNGSGGLTITDTGAAKARLGTILPALPALFGAERILVSGGNDAGLLSIARAGEEDRSDRLATSLEL